MTATIASEPARVTAVLPQPIAAPRRVTVSMSRRRPRQWDAFAPDTAHPANTSGFALVHRSLRVRPMWLEASVDGFKVAQWLIFRVRSWRPGRRGIVFSNCAPQIVPEADRLSDGVFSAFIDQVREELAPADIQVHNYALVRGLDRQALLGAGFRRMEASASYVNRLTTDDELLARFHSTHRTATRRAMREGYAYCPVVTPREYIKLSRETYEAHGLAGPSPTLIRRIHRHMVPRGSAHLSGVRVNGDLKVASVVLHGGQTAYYLHGASGQQKDRFAGPYLQFENMRRLRDLGLRYYDFGGAKVGEGHSDKALSISEFKRKFGGELIDVWGGTWQ